MITLTSTRLQLLPAFVLFIVVGCGTGAPVDPGPATVDSSSDQSDQASAETGEPSAPNYDAMIDIIVKGSLPDATDEAEDKEMAALEEAEAFDAVEMKAFASALEKRLSDESPYMRMEAAWLLALWCDSPAGNPDLVPVFVDLLNHDEMTIKRSAARRVADVIVNQKLSEAAKPLVAPLIAALQDSDLVYAAIYALEKIGPAAREAVPFIRSAAERENDETINKVSVEAVSKLEGSGR